MSHIENHTALKNAILDGKCVLPKSLDFLREINLDLSKDDDRIVNASPVAGFERRAPRP